jgi:hypothetical protein
MLDLMRSIAGTALGHTMLASRWLFALMEVLHFVGLALLIAGIAAFDLRVLGVAPRLPLASVHRFVVLSLAGFTLTAVSGVLFFVADPVRYGTNPIFMVKMALIAMAGINAWRFERLWTTQLQHVPAGGPLPTAARMFCAASLLIWTVVIITGRVLPQFSRTF